MTTYRVITTPGSRLRTDEQAQKVGVFLEERFGEEPITPAVVVDAARPKRSPLHDLFEWDDAAAAEAHRQNQARAVLRSISIVRADEDENGGRPLAASRAYQSVALVTPLGVRRAYLAERVVWRSPELADQVVAQALSELRTWTAKYHAYRELAQALRLVEEALA